MANYETVSLVNDIHAVNKNADSPTEYLVASEWRICLSHLSGRRLVRKIENIAVAIMTLNTQLFPVGIE